MKMKKYLSLLRYEFKTIVKERMNVFMLFYPFLMLVITAYLLPAIIAKTGAGDSQGTAITLLIAFVMLLGVGGYVMGAMLGFSLLENRDEKTILNISVTPITVSGYVVFKVIYTYVLSFLGNLIMVGGLKLLASDKYVVTFGGQTIGLLDNFDLGRIIIFALVNSFLVPVVAAIVGGFAKNKIEGFAMMKTGALFIMIPDLTLIPELQGGWQYVLGITPNFWGLKAMLNLATNNGNAANLGYYGYMAIGVVYQLIITVFALRMLVKKSS